MKNVSNLGTFQEVNNHAPQQIQSSYLCFAEATNAVRTIKESSQFM